MACISFETSCILFLNGFCDESVTCLHTVKCKTVQFQTIQFNISTQFFVCKKLNLKTVQFQ